MDFTGDFMGEPNKNEGNWINADSTPKAGFKPSRSRKPRADAAQKPTGNFDKFKYNNSSSSKLFTPKVTPKITPPSASESLFTPKAKPAGDQGSMVGMMPVPVPKKPKLNSIHRRL